MKKARRKRRGSVFTDSKKSYLEFGRLFFSSHRTEGGYGVLAGVVTAEILRDAEQHAPDIVAEFIRTHPGQRPWIWWVTHLGVPAGQRFHSHEVSAIVGMPASEYLIRNDLLNSAERIRLSICDPRHDVAE